MSAPATVLAALPSPTQGVWHLGPLPLRAYALVIVAGIFLAVWYGERRWRARGGREAGVYDIAFPAVIAGIVGGRVYHVLTSPELYFAEGRDPWRAFFVWEGGLGIWGAVVLGGVGAWWGCRRHGLLLPPMADALAPAIVLAQAVGRWGNWFNNELYGGPTDLPWRLRVYEWAGGEAVVENGEPVVKGYFHPTFLYESLWCLGVAVLLVWADRRFRMGHGRVFALYVVAYSLGRLWIEALRIDEANLVLGLRLNIWTCLVAIAGGTVYLVVSGRLRPGRETVLERTPPAAGEPVAAEGPLGAGERPQAD